MTLFIQLCSTFEKISNTSKRLEIQSILTSFLSDVITASPQSLAASLLLSTASIYPQYHNVELGIGESIIQAVVSEGTGLSLAAVKQKYIKTGDLGRIAMENRVAQLFISRRQLTVEEVLGQLRKIAKEKGKNSTNTKKNIMLGLVSACSPLETKYIIRLFECQLKIGLALQTVLISLSQAVASKVENLGMANQVENLGIANQVESQRVASNVEGQRMADQAETTRITANQAETTKITANQPETTKRIKDNSLDNTTKDTSSLDNIIKDAYNKHPDFEYLADVILNHGLANLDKFCSITPGIPVKPMLAQPSKNLTKAFSKLEDDNFLSEYKYDGERVQIHHSEGTTRIFSRNSEDLTAKYPDIADLEISPKSFILDGEAVAYSDGEIGPFQLLSTRKRKNIDKIDVTVCVFVFDLLFYDGEDLSGHPLKVRRDMLRQKFSEIEGRLKMATGVECTSVEDIDAHFRQAIEANCEGVMLKSLKTGYRPSHRSNKWIKVKKDYLENLGDSLDLVVIGAFYGKGKRTGQYGGFLLGVYNDETGKIEPCCKIGTGFSEEQLQVFYEELSPLVTASSERIGGRGDGRSTAKPDVWIEPTYVWEVKAASLSLSPIYTAGMMESAGEEERGISLRFPRFIKERKDKKVEDATTSNLILRMYNDSKNVEDSSDEFN